MTRGADDQRPESFVYIRSPLLPWNAFAEWADGTRSARATEEELRGALAADEGLLRARLREFFAMPEVLEALYISSPSLYAELPRWIESPGSEYGRRLDLSLTKYFARMSARPTPFGLMSGCTLGEIGAVTDVRLAPRPTYRRKTRLDHDFVFNLAAALDAGRALQRDLVYTPNTSLYRVGDRYRYIETRSREGRREYHEVSVEASEHLGRAIALAERGAVPGEIAGALAAELDVDLGEAREFIDELIDQQLLVSDLQPRLSGGGAADDLVSRLRASAAGAEAAGALGAACDALSRLDAAGIGNDVEGYRAAAAVIEPLPVRPDPSRLFQIDMFKPATSATIDRALADELLAAARVLTVFSRARSTEIDAFRDGFMKRFGEREVPLTLALDSEAGVGFPAVREDESIPSTLLEGIGFPSSAAARQREHRPSEELVVRKWSEAVRTGAREIVIDPSELADYESDPLPPLVGIVGALVDTNIEPAYAAILYSVLGESAATHLGRFCHGDPDLTALLARHLQREEAATPDVVFAEVVHLPEERVANVIAHPVLRQYEIPYLGRSGAPRQNQILATDLDVSVASDGAVVLRSRTLGKRVVPRMANAYNFRLPGNLPLFRFLGALEEQATGPIWAWNWAGLDTATFLPRVRTGRVVLAPAFWVIDEQQTGALPDDRMGRFRAMQALRERLGLPRFIYVADADNTLAIDFENVISTDAFAAGLKKRGTTTILEIVPPPEASVVTGPEGRFVHDVIIPFGSDRPLVAPLPRRIDVSCPRTFEPGSEWLYAKLYCGLATADEMLIRAIAPLASVWLRDGVIDRWFFLRYWDPDFHLRVRFHGGSPAAHARLLSELRDALQPYSSAETLHRIEVGTYEREVERYGGARGIELCESLFHIDSEAAVAALESLASEEAHDLRWRVALLGADMLLEDFGLSVPERQSLAGALFKAHASALGVDSHIRRQMGAVFRRERESLADLRERTAPPALQPSLEILEERSRRGAEAVARLREPRNHATTTLDALAASLVHMQINRMLRGSHRPHEAAIYFLLEKQYQGELARSRRTVES